MALRGVEDDLPRREGGVNEGRGRGGASADGSLAPWYDKVMIVKWVQTDAYAEDGDYRDGLKP